MRDAPSNFARALTWVMVVVLTLLLIVGVASYGFSLEIHQRFWADIIGRFGGPMTFRFILQPVMALVTALPDGIADARYGRSAFFWTQMGDPTMRHGRLKEGLISIARVMMLGLGMDVIYQMRVFDRFYPAEAVMMAILLALIPYFFFRPIVERVARWWLGRARPGQPNA